MKSRLLTVSAGSRRLFFLKAKAVRRHCIITVCVLFLSSCAINNVEQYPSNWPARPTLLSHCSDVSGTYADRRTPDPTSPPRGAQLFLFLGHVKAPTLRLYDNTAKSRALHVYFDSNRALHLDYLINGTRVASITRARSVYQCGKHGLIIPMYHREGAHIFDMLPNHGRYSVSLLMFRAGDYLYVEWDDHAEARFWHVIPETSHYETWVRFLTAGPRIDGPGPRFPPAPCCLGVPESWLFSH